MYTFAAIPLGAPPVYAFDRNKAAPTSGAVNLLLQANASGPSLALMGLPRFSTPLNLRGVVDCLTWFRNDFALRLGRLQPPTREGLTPRDAAQARVVNDFLKSRGINCINDRAHYQQLMSSSSTPANVRSAMQDLYYSGAYNKIEQRDVANLPDGRSARANFDTAAKVWGY